MFSPEFGSLRTRYILIPTRIGTRPARVGRSRSQRMIWTGILDGVNSPTPTSQPTLAGGTAEAASETGCRLLLEPRPNGERAWCAVELVMLAPSTVVSGRVLTERGLSDPVHRRRHVEPSVSSRLRHGIEPRTIRQLRGIQIRLFPSPVFESFCRLDGCVPWQYRQSTYTSAGRCPWMMG